jgi:glyoxylase-like metal-dependent hydrolase (beta-lactamase superfamily II)
MRFGALELVPLIDGRFRLDGGAMFGVVPKPLWERKAPADERNRIRLAMRPLLVRGDRTLLVDAGIGDKMEPKAVEIYAIDRQVSLADSLAAEGLREVDIDLVLASHLHFDHAGGFTRRDERGGLVPVFPRARYLARAGEYDDATHPHERNRASYLADNYVPLHQAGVLDLHEGNVEVRPGVRVVRTGGHTMHHQVVYLESEGRTAVFAADLIPTTAHVDSAWVMGYDLYPMDTFTFKRAFIREAIDQEYLIFFEHDPEVAAGYIREAAGRRFVEPVVRD